MEVHGADIANDSFDRVAAEKSGPANDVGSELYSCLDCLSRDGFWQERLRGISLPWGVTGACSAKT